MTSHAIQHPFITIGVVLLAVAVVTVYVGIKRWVCDIDSPNRRRYITTTAGEL
jgi:uncharacterized membrane protein YidH (DUF202 family)